MKIYGRIVGLIYVQNFYLSVPHFLIMTGGLPTSEFFVLGAIFGTAVVLVGLSIGIEATVMNVHNLDERSTRSGIGRSKSEN